MAVTQKPLAFGTVTGTALTPLYTNTIVSTIHPFLVVTNTTASVTKVQISVESGSVNRILAEQKIPGGFGRNWRVLELSDLRIGSGYVINLQMPSGGTVNFFLSGVEFTSA